MSIRRCLRKAQHPYFCLAVITLTTAGLGDFVPTSDGAKVVCSIFIYFGVACIGLLLGSYIAGMLDESSRRAAHANRIKSCPNCVRIQNIRDTAERRRNQYKKQGKEFDQRYDMVPIAFVDGDRLSHDAKRVKRQHLQGSLEDQTRGFSSERQTMVHAHTKSAEWKYTPGEVGSDFHFGSFSPASVIQAAPKQSSSSDGVPLTPRSIPVPTPPSPFTINMLYRQSHSRHASFDLDLGGSQYFADAVVKKSPARKYSADLGVPATIEETTMPQPHADVAPPLPKDWDDGDIHESDSHSSDDEGDEFSSTSSETPSGSSTEESSLDLEDQYNGVRNARYVFLTLREALVNSLVIIGTGCFGFYFIEGFSFIDSWYFTTVLLTVRVVLHATLYSA